MILSLLISLLFFTTAVAIVGVSEIGSLVIGEGTATSQLNATAWNVISALGGFTIFLIVVIVFILLLLIGTFKAASIGGLGD
jgi:hypothetical protein